MIWNCPRSWLFTLVGIGLVVGLTPLKLATAQAQVLTSPPQVDAPTVTMQESSASSGITPLETGIVERASLETDITNSKASLRGQILEYRTAERNFTVTREQWRQLGTLASLESAVVATKEAMRLRNLVLMTHVTLLKLQLIEARGVPLPAKQIALDDLDLVLATLTQHDQEIQKVTDRQTAAIATQNFSTFSEYTQGLTTYVNNLLIISKLQDLYDQTEVLISHVETQVVEPKTDLRQDERRRALIETKQELSVINQNLGLLKVAAEKNDRGQFPETLSEAAPKELATTYNGLGQVHRYLDELLKL
jgi:predicted component of type VI protein secretion system